MARGDSRTPARVLEARAEASAQRTVARWSAVQVILPALFAAACVVGAAWQLHGSHTSVNLTMGVSISVVVPAAAAKLAADRREKRRMRTRLEGLEAENKELNRKNGELEGRVNELRSLRPKAKS